MNIKGTAAGGGNALLIPMTEFSMGLTGDINDITNSHNLAMVALTARMQHERNYNDGNTFAAALTTGFTNEFTGKGSNNSLEATVSKANSSYAQLFLAYPDTPAAEDTFIGVVDKYGAAGIYW
ncbi:unnamed protein product [marine sediment metagenome]|uniref:Uncharacterized protein n=1 Tax=marine sediment metagenome TaxID=412755 RepID=X0YHY7_9ZZZZ